MKTPILLLAMQLVLGTSSQAADPDSKAPKDEKQPASASSPSRPPLPVPFEITPLAEPTTGGPTAPSRAITFSKLEFGTNAVVVTGISNRLDLIQSDRLRLEGGLVPVVKVPSLVTFLQLFNPFAPAEYGGMQVNAASQGFGRVFADPVKDGPSSVLFSVGANPPKANEPIKSR